MEGDLSDTEKTALSNELRRHQLLGEQFLLKKAAPVNVDLRAHYVLADADKREETEELLRDLIEDQCYSIGGTFDPARFVREANQLEGVSGFSMQVPLDSQRLSDFAYFSYDPDRVSFTAVDTSADLPPQRRNV